jgi:hypothetical protein
LIGQKKFSLIGRNFNMKRSFGYINREIRGEY